MSSIALRPTHPHLAALCTGCTSFAQAPVDPAAPATQPWSVDVALVAHGAASLDKARALAAEMGHPKLAL